jgi:LCP family protein required for cell wall assembly
MNKRKFLVAMLTTISMFFMVAGGVGLANLLYGTNLSEDVVKLLDSPVTDKVNILVLGFDIDRIRSDVMMLVSVDPKQNTVKVVSIPRDTRVKIKEGKYDKINHTMGYKNPEELVIRVVKEVTGMPINYYCEIDFVGFREVIDILGGVDFDVPVNMHYEDPAQGLKIHVNKGFQHLGGNDAEGVVRFRHTYVNGDEGRIAVQQDFMKALFQQKLNPVYITKAPELLDQIYGHVKTNFSAANALSYMGMLKTLTPESLATFQLPGEARYMNNLWYYIYDAEETKRLVREEFGYENGAEVTPAPTISPIPASTNP